MGRIGGSHVELRVAGIGKSDHADDAVLYPGLPGGDLDRVVAVGLLGRVEEVEGAARAAGPSDVHADGGETEGTGDHGARLGLLGIRGVVARVLNDGRIGRGAVEPRVGEADHGRERDAVAHGEVVHALLEGVAVDRLAADDLHGNPLERLTGVKRFVRMVVATVHAEGAGSLDGVLLLVADHVAGTDLEGLPSVGGGEFAAPRVDDRVL